MYFVTNDDVIPCLIRQLIQLILVYEHNYKLNAVVAIIHVYINYQHHHKSS